MTEKHLFSAKFIEQARKIMSCYEEKRAALLPILHFAQDNYGYISTEIEKQVADLVQIAPIKVREVLSFYTLYNRKPVGKHQLQICHNLSCTLRGADDLIGYLKEKLCVEDGGTSHNRKYTLKTVECLGACEIAPMMRLDDRYIGQLTKQKIDETLKGLSS